MSQIPKIVLIVISGLMFGGCVSTGGLPSGDESAQAGDLDFHLLLAEIARERGQFEEAARHYRDAALLSADPSVAERAAMMAESTGLNDVGLEAATRWLKLAPTDARVFRFLGTFELRGGNYRKAADHFEHLVQESPDVDLGLELVVGLIGAEEDRIGATEVMQHLVERHSESASGHYGLGRLALRGGANKLALEQAQLAVELDSEAVDNQLLMARALLVNGQVEEGLRLAESLTLRYDDPGVRLEYAELLLAAQRQDEARLLLNDVLEEVPGMPEAVRALAFLELSAGDLDASRQRFDELKLGQRYRTEAFYYLGRISETEDQYLQAVRYYSRVTQGSSAVEAQLRASQLLYEELGDADGALRHLQDFAVANPRLATPMLLGRGRLLVMMDRAEEAVALLEEARQKDDKDGTLADAQAQLYMFTAQRALARDDLVGAEMALDQGLEIRPGEPALRYSKALLLEQTGRLKKSVAILEDLVDEHPEDALALNALGYTLADRTTRFTDARRYIQRALAIEPNNSAVLDSMGWVLFKLGEHDAAVTFLQRALGLQRDPEIAAHLVQVHLALEQRQTAMALLEEFLAENPDDPILQPLKESLAQ
jgi:tetratricopeptide (TPR) repeat protein